MAVPTIDSVFPNNGSSGIPLGAEVEITFDRGIDLKSGESNVVIYGVDFDRTSGPDSALWIDEQGNNPYFLKSPGFSGTVDCEYELFYVDAGGAILDPQPVVNSEADEIANNYRHKLLVKPKALLAPNANYTVYIIGNSEGGTSKGITARTVFEIVPTVINPEATMVCYGGYEGVGDDTLHVKITTPGDIGQAKYKWWYAAAGEPSATLGKTTSRRYRRLEDGLQIRFTGSNYSVGDEFTFNVMAPDFLEDSFTFTFDTGTGSIIEVPDTASTSVIGTSSSLSASNAFLEILDMDPEDGSSHMPLDTRTISIKFSADLDPATITQDNVAIYAYPVSGRYGGKEVNELVKKLTVNGDELIIEI